ncbi:MAG TPA: CheR family methyltransferase [Anaeromyxobacteraceae bacterium]|nr:CheR family methyltransferase [Anaeromyxobacteraceae bacterium]
MSAGLDRPQLERLRRAVARRLGLQLDDGKLDELARVATRRLSTLGSPPADRWLEQVEAGHGPELDALAERLTVGETYFFRNWNDLRAFLGAVIPERVRARGAERRLRILSAGCASGEEPYTLAMLVRQVPELERWDLAIRGVDLNPAALARAVSGRYSRWSLRQTPPELQRRFFQQDRHEFRLVDEVRAMVRFEQANLVEGDPRIFAPASWDVIFCRNVTMYFGREVARRVVDRLASSLAPGGFLFLGHAETLRGLSTRFHLRQSHDTFYYQVRGEDEAERPPPPPAPMVAPDAPEAPPERAPAEAQAPEVAWLQAIHDASQRIAALSVSAAPSPAPPPPPAAPGHSVARALELFGRERFGDALSALGSPALEEERDPDVLLLRAVLLSAGGDHAGAERVCGRILELDELSAEAHYLLALCREQAGDLPAAADQDRYAAYLDPTFSMPCLHLGLMAKRRGDAAAARRELSRAAVLLPAEEASRILLLGGGFSRDALAELCRAELRASGGET